MEGLTPEQIAENERIKNLPVITNLSTNQIKIMDLVEKLSKTVENEQVENNARFDEGSEKFKELSTELKEVKSEVGAMKTQIENGFNRLSKEAHERSIQEKDDEIKKLNKKLDGNSYIKNGVIITLLGGILLYVAVEVIKSINVHPPAKAKVELQGN